MKHPIQFLRSLLSNSNTARAPISQKKLADELGISPGYLSDILKEKRIITEAIALKLHGWLESTGVAGQEFLDSIEVYKEAYYGAVPWEKACDLYQFKSNIMHDLIVEIAQTKNYQANVRWIAKRLKKTSEETKEAYQRCIRLGLLTEIGEYAHSINFPARSESQMDMVKKQNIKHAADCIEAVPIDLRQVSGAVFSCNKGKLRVAKRLISEFAEKLCELSTSDESDEVYSFSFQLFSLESSKKKK